MFKKFYDDLTYLPKKKFNAKYTIPALLVFLTCVLIGQFLSMLVPLSDLNKVSGHIVGMDTQITSWSRARYSNHSTPNYALFIHLDNSQSYDIQDEITRGRLGLLLKQGDDVTIYYPTTALKIVSAGFVRDVSQLERRGQVLYSWKEQQNGVWFIIGMLALAIVAFYWLKGYLRDYVDVPKFQ
jgi:hypothetical protein